MKSTRVVRGLIVLGALSMAAVGLGTVGSAAAAEDFVPGSPGLGDPFFPNAGNGGYDVTHYSLTLSYEPSTNQLSGTATITATRDAEPLQLRPRPAGLFDLRAWSSTGRPRRLRAAVSRSS